MFAGVEIGTQQNTLAQGTVFDAKQRPWRPLAFLALAFNLCSWPLVIITLCELPQSGVGLVWALALAVIGLALASSAAREFRAERRGLPSRFLQSSKSNP